MSLLLNRAKCLTATTGTGTITIGAAVVPYQSWAAAQAGTTSITRRYSYLIEDGTDWEIGEGVYNETANTLTRNLIASSTGALLSLSGAATVANVAKAADSPQVIEKKVFAGGETSFSFTDIPQDFTDLELEVVGRLQVAAATQVIPITVNGLTTNIYDSQRQWAVQATNSAGENMALTSWANQLAIPGTSFAAGQSSRMLMRLFGYAGSVFWKNAHHWNDWPSATGAGATGSILILHGSVHVRTTAPITSIEVGTIPASGQMVAGSYAVLRGIP
jgi:hypothetical protein